MRLVDREGAYVDMQVHLSNCVVKGWGVKELSYMTLYCLKKEILFFKCQP